MWEFRDRQKYVWSCIYSPWHSMLFKTCILLSSISAFIFAVVVSFSRSIACFVIVDGVFGCDGDYLDNACAKRMFTGNDPQCVVDISNQDWFMIVLIIFGVFFSDSTSNHSHIAFVLIFATAPFRATNIENHIYDLNKTIVLLCHQNNRCSRTDFVVAFCLLQPCLRMEIWLLRSFTAKVFVYWCWLFSLLVYCYFFFSDHLHFGGNRIQSALHTSNHACTYLFWLVSFIWVEHVAFQPQYWDFFFFYSTRLH